MQPRETRKSLLDAATEIFAEKGFSGARVDEIARKGRANKAMIYYHFGTKRDLYQAVLLDQFSTVLQEIDRLDRDVADPKERLVGFYTGLVRRCAERTTLPRIMMREVLAGGAHLEKPTAAVFAATFRFIGGALRQGAGAGDFRPAEPLLVHLSMIGPILLYFVSEPFRRRLVPMMLSMGVPGLASPTPQDLLAHLEHQLTRMLPAAAPVEEQRS